MANLVAPFEVRLLTKLRQQITSRKVGFLLGAGASYLAGRGFPLASTIWPAIKGTMPPEDQQRIEEWMARSGLQLEETLDALEAQASIDQDVRHRISAAVAHTFGCLKPPLDCHQDFVARLSGRSEKVVPVFTLNYDCLVECGADSAQASLVDGFCGTFEASFQPGQFDRASGNFVLRRGRRVFVPRPGTISLYKLHGSLGWFADAQGHLKRMRPDLPCPTGWRRLMIPPQHRKASDTGFTPYATLWSEFRAFLSNDTHRLLNRLLCVGYGLGDGHVNAILDAALQRDHFTLIVLARGLSDHAFNKYAGSPKAIVVTEGRSSLYGEHGGGVSDAWSFEWLSKEV